MFGARFDLFLQEKHLPKTSGTLAFRVDKSQEPFPRVQASRRSLFSCFEAYSWVIRNNSPYDIDLGSASLDQRINHENCVFTTTVDVDQPSHASTAPCAYFPAFPPV